MEISGLDKGALDRYLSLSTPSNKCQVMYVWVDASGVSLRSKTKTINFVPKKPSELPIWSYSGSSTGLTSLDDSDVFLHPVAMYKDPFRLDQHKIVLCETYIHTDDKKIIPTKSNQRHHCVNVMADVRDHEPWFGMKQEYVLLDSDDHPYGWPRHGFPAPEGEYYCAVGADKVHGRDIIEAHYRACLYSGINIAGVKSDTMLSQWEFQVGPLNGVDIGDDLWMARYFIHRVAEDFEVSIALDPKVVPGNWHGAGLHCNFSTKQMREENGLDEIYKAVEKLKNRHKVHMEAYGSENTFIIPGYKPEEKKDIPFSSGVGNRGVAVRIPRIVAEDHKGYFEDRRPCSNADPYVIAEAIAKSVCLT